MMLLWDTNLRHELKLQGRLFRFPLLPFSIIKSWENSDLLMPWRGFISFEKCHCHRSLNLKVQGLLITIG